MAFAEDFTAPFTDFGTAATVGGATVRGIFDADYATAFSDIAGTQPSFLCASSAVAAVAIGAALSVNSTSYTVAEIQPDGTGLTRLILEAV